MKIYGAITYKRYIFLMFFLCTVPIIYPMLGIIFKQPDEPYNMLFVIVPYSVAILFMLIISFLRKIALKIIECQELDMQRLCELDYRTPKNKIHNTTLLMNMYFYKGDFQNAIICANEILNAKAKPHEIYIARNKLILSCFFKGEWNQLKTLIKQQKDTPPPKKVMIELVELYYHFIEHYIDGNYKEAIKTAQKILNDKHMVILFNIKAMAFYFMKISYAKLGEEALVKKYEQEILDIDENRLTFFSK